MNKEVVRKLVKASGVSNGELILIHFWGEDEEKSIANLFMTEVAALGASPVLLQQSRTINRDMFMVTNDNCFNQKYFDMLSGFDAVLDVFTYRPVILGYEIEEKQFNLYRKYMSQLFSTLMNSKRFTQIRIPTAANAEEAGLDAEDFINRMMKAYDIDYTYLEQACKVKVEDLSMLKEITLRTGTDASLHFELGDRKWFIDAGDGDLPCGEVAIAPLEDKTNGTVYFEKLYLEDNGLAEKVTFTVSNGKIDTSDNECVNEFLAKLPEESKVVCELGFGMNPNVTDLCGYTVLDEKMAGTFHIAIGANTMFGGENNAGTHIDFVGLGQI